MIRRFDFLGFSFKPRSAVARTRARVFTTFTPAVSDRAVAAIQREVRSWNLGQRTSQSLQQLLQEVTPKLRGWVPYYAAFRPSTLYRMLRPIDDHLVLWARRKYKRLAKHRHRAWEWLKRLQSRQPRLFPHWWAAVMSTGR